MSTSMFLACQNEVRQERIQRTSMVFSVEFSDSNHRCKQNRGRSLHFGSVKKGLVLSGSKDGVPWQFEARKLWQIACFSVKLQRYLSLMQVCELKWSYDCRESYFCERTAAMKATYCLGSSSSWTSCIWGRNCKLMSPFLEHNH